MGVKGCKKKELRRLVEDRLFSTLEEQSMKHPTSLELRKGSRTSVINNNSEKKVENSHQNVMISKKDKKKFGFKNTIGEAEPLEAILEKAREWEVESKADIQMMGNDFFLISFSTTIQPNSARSLLIKITVGLDRWKIVTRRKKHDPYKEQSGSVSAGRLNDRFRHKPWFNKYDSRSQNKSYHFESRRNQAIGASRAKFINTGHATIEPARSNISKGKWLRSEEKNNMETKKGNIYGNNENEDDLGEGNYEDGEQDGDGMEEDWTDHHQNERNGTEVEGSRSSKGHKEDNEVMTKDNMGPNNSNGYNEFL
uniref:Uncharacterized protein n=1 Tax=Nelumbo nucifera TaxID=4432 RepID=A0A822Y4J4_NELNU|nr:TPA_asm: hypothetical protein HUJ06_027624 [Nelumbo nucifera]